MRNQRRHHRCLGREHALGTAVDREHSLPRALIADMVKAFHQSGQQHPACHSVRSLDQVIAGPGNVHVALPLGLA
jgi:hypothetical protein